MKRLPTRFAWLCIVTMTTLSSVPAARAFGGGPKWTIGRAVIVTVRQDMSSYPIQHLKLSLRNIGVPGRIPVSIYGRWSSMQVGRRNTLPGGMSAQPAWQGPGGGMSGRWSQAPAMMPSARAARPGGGNVARSSVIGGGRPVGMRLLGRFVREVSLTNTAILEIPLPATRSRGNKRLEIDVMSGSVVTDHQFINAAD